MKTEEFQATRVPDARRMPFLPELFGVKYMMTGERAVFQYMEYLCKDYTGGYWEFYKTPSGAMFMAPRGEKRLHLSCDTNYFSGDMSAQAAGIVATLFALNHLAHKTLDQHIAEQYQLLRAAAGDHPEAPAIYGAID